MASLTLMAHFCAIGRHNSLFLLQTMVLRLKRGHTILACLQTFGFRFQSYLHARDWYRFHTYSVINVAMYAVSCLQKPGMRCFDVHFAHITRTRFEKQWCFSYLSGMVHTFGTLTVRLRFFVFSCFSFPNVG